MIKKLFKNESGIYRLNFQKLKEKTNNYGSEPKYFQYKYDHNERYLNLLCPKITMISIPLTKRNLANKV